MPLPLAAAPPPAKGCRLRPPRKEHYCRVDGGLRKHRCASAVRVVPLLVMTVYCVVFVFRLAGAPDAGEVSAAGGESKFRAQIAVNSNLDGREDSEPPPPPLKTHLTTNPDAGALQAREELPASASLSCSALINGEEVAAESSPATALCCDRSHSRTDLCYARGDVRLDPPTLTVLLYGAPPGTPLERIRPYTRKFEAGITNTIEQLTIVPIPSPAAAAASPPWCDVRHRTRGLVFSTGGYTGNVYHDFSDGLIPLYITASRFAGEVVLVVLDYHAWWINRYGPVVEQLTGHRVVDLRHDKRVHCFPELILGMRYHDELSIDPDLMPHGESIRDFQKLLHRGFHRSHDQHRQPSSTPAALPEPSLPLPSSRPCSSKPRMVIFIRKQTRVLANSRDVVAACKRAGFQVRVFHAQRTTPLFGIHEAAASADAMLAVHGAAMTHLLFMRPGTVLIQLVPIGLEWVAENYYAKPAERLGLRYYEYRVGPDESSLSAEFGANSSVVRDPSIISSQGWWEMKKTYMDRQNVTVNVRRFSADVLVKARTYLQRVASCSGSGNASAAAAGADE